MNDMNDKPLVSIIVRTKDRPKLLKRALQSIADQTYRPIEVVLVNDGGCDLDGDEIERVLGDVSLNYIRIEKNVGRAHAGNIGIENAKGEYIGFLDDDDEFYPDHLQTLISFLKQSDCKVAYTDAFFVYKTYDAATYEIKDIKSELAFSQDFDYAGLVFENYIPFMCLLFDKNVLLESGGFDGNFKLYEDWDLLIRLGDKFMFQHIRKATANYNQWSSELQISQTNRDHDFLKQCYVNVVSKHIDKITANRVHGYVAAHGHSGELATCRSQLNDRKADIIRFEDALKEMAEHIGGLEAALKEKETSINGLEAGAWERDTHIVNLEAAVGEKDEHIAIIENALGQKEAYIQLIQSGRGWKLLNKYFSVRDRLLPQGTKRRLFVKLLFKAVANPRELLRNLNKTNFKKFCCNLRNSDPLTIEKKIEQKLSFGSTDQEPIEAGMTEHGLASKITSKKYFNFLFGMNTKKGEEYVPLSYPNIPETDIKLIAFYLPQFHPIPENDEWWGKGFTEWTNVARAVPQFIGHYQPRLPGELGFYDLRIPEVQQRQMELARQYGIHGFCFHFYWFGGRTLLERPIMNFAENCNYPFCINWANENWTRRWDGRENDVLIAQKHSPDDDIEFIKHVSKYLSNSNYIRIDSKPLLMIYRVALLPDPKATGQRWREWCRKNGIGEIYLAAVRSFEEVDPGSIGFDALIEFPPHALPFRDVSSQFTVVNSSFKGVITDYQETAKFYLESNKPTYKKFRGIVPGWDNEARIPGRGKVLVNSTPDNFKQWLKIICSFTRDNFERDERLIFINAWNEWGEGTYLEPDRRYGYAYLRAVAEALIEHNFEKKQKKILYVCHDAFFAGAQLLSLNIIRMFKLKFHYDVHFILKLGGELELEYAKYGTVYNLARNYKTLKEKEGLIEHLYKTGIREAICSSVASGDLVKLLHKKGIKTVTLVHELPDIIKNRGIEENARFLAEYSYRVVFPSEFVKEKFETIVETNDEKTEILPQGLYRYNEYKDRTSEARKELRQMFSLPDNTKIILGVGVGDFRKGVDLFTEVAKITTQERKDIYFIWVGDLHPEIKEAINLEPDTEKHIIFQGTRKDISVFYAGADIYLLTSREDPFPTVVLDAMHVGLPVIGFHEAGGFRDIVNENTGALVPYLDVHAMAEEVIRLLDDTSRRKVLEANTHKLVEEKFNFTDYVYNLLAFLGDDYRKVSVIVPNYNYEKYLKLRMKSILNQTYPVYEIIFLDDASTDNSVKLATTYLEEGLNVKVLRNAVNSGSAFKQWLRGLRVAKGDYIWIAEADDVCEDTFLEELLSCFEKDRDVVMAYCQSKQIDERGTILADNYFEYANDIDKEKWKRDYVREGVQEIADTLVFKNTIPNVSAVVFKNLDVAPIEDELVTYRVAGDWFFYIWLLQRGRIAYISKSLNYHRRHDRGITKSEDKELLYNEIVKMQESIIKDFDVTVDAIDKCHSYREYLTEYLGLPRREQV